MISEARREPSRRNGRCSRGPTTSEGKASSSRNAVRHGPSRPAGLDPILADRGSPRWRAPSQGRMPGCSGSPRPSRVHAENHFPGLPRTKPISANEANGGKLVKTTFEDEQGELKREQRLIMRLFGHTSRDDFYWLGIRRVAVASPRSRRTNPTQRSPVCTISARRTQAAAAMPESRRTDCQAISGIDPLATRGIDPGVADDTDPSRSATSITLAKRTRARISPRALLWPNEPKPDHGFRQTRARCDASRSMGTASRSDLHIRMYDMYNRRLKHYC